MNNRLFAGLSMIGLEALMVIILIINWTLHLLEVLIIGGIFAVFNLTAIILIVTGAFENDKK